MTQSLTSEPTTYQQAIATVLDAVREYGPQTPHYRALGNIVARLHPNGELLIFNYTAQAMFQQTWTPVECVCRGLIVHWPTATVVARPFPKFFNLGQTAATSYQRLPPGEMEVTQKLDGSLGIVYHNGQDWAVATRGSFDNEQSHWATVWLRMQANLAAIPRDTTLLVEIIYPGNRVVVDYGAYQGLTLLAAQPIDHDIDLPYHDVARLGAAIGLPVVERVAVASLDALEQMAATATNIEGWVVRWSNGLRVKIKAEEYLRLHRAMTGFNVHDIWEALKADKPLNQRFADMPDEFLGWLKAEGKRLTGEYTRLHRLTHDTYKRLTHEVQITLPAAVGPTLNGAEYLAVRRVANRAMFDAFAQYPDIRYFLEALYKGETNPKKLHDQIWDAIEPLGQTTTFKVMKEDIA